MFDEYGFELNELSGLFYDAPYRLSKNKIEQNKSTVKQIIQVPIFEAKKNANEFIKPAPLVTPETEKILIPVKTTETTKTTKTNPFPWWLLLLGGGGLWYLTKNNKKRGKR